MPLLDHIKVIELADFQTAGGDVLLAEMGADVIKIEHPVRGDTLRGFSTMAQMQMDLPGGRNIAFETSNRSKRSMTLKLDTDLGKEIFYKLIDKADIFYTNYRQTVLKKLSADYEVLSKRKPSLVYGFISAFGSKGPLGERRGYDLQAQACSGLMWAMGERDIDEPMLAYGSICDQTGGTMLALGLLAALVGRETSGVGQKVEVSMYGSMLHLQATGINITSFRNRPWARHSRTRVREPMSNYYRCADGKYILLCELRGDEYWPQLAQALGLNDLVTDPKYATVSGRKTNYELVIKTLDKAFASKTLQEWMDYFSKMELDRSGLAYSPVQNYFDVLNDPQAAANDYIVTYNHPAVGQTKLNGFPINFSKTPSNIKHAAPEHGQHTVEILSEELGYSWEQIGDLSEKGII